MWMKTKRGPPFLELPSEPPSGPLSGTPKFSVEKEKS